MKITKLWDTRVILLVLVVAVLAKRAASPSDLSRVARSVQDLSLRLDEFELRIASVEASRAAPAVRTDDGPPRASAPSEDPRPVVDAPSDWRFSVVRGEPCVLFGRDHRFMLRSGHVTRFGRILVVGPESVLTDRCIVAFRYGNEESDGNGSI